MRTRLERLFWRRPGLVVALQLTPALGWLAVFFLVPLVLIAVYSVGRRAEGGGVVFTFTLQHYVRVLSSSYYLGITWQSLVLSLKVTAVTLLLGYPVAYLLATTRSRWKPFLVFLLLVPWWTSILVKNFAWVGILLDNGLVNRVLLGAGLVDRPLKLLYTEFSVTVGLVHLLIPFMTLPLFATLEKLDPQLLEASGNLGAGPIASFREVTLPLSLPGIASGCILTFILAFGSFVTPALLGGSRNWMVAMVVQDQFLNAFNWPLGSAVAIVLLLVVLVLVLGFNRLVGLEKIWGEVR
jgi:spermidine/putrescine transport system permease protein